jgi:hypothetical protein
VRPLKTKECCPMLTVPKVRFLSATAANRPPRSRGCIFFFLLEVFCPQSRSFPSPSRPLRIASRGLTSPLPSKRLERVSLFASRVASPLFVSRCVAVEINARRRFLIRRRTDRPNLWHQIRRDMLQMRLYASWMQRLVVFEKRQIGGIVLKVSLATRVST